MSGSLDAPSLGLRDLVWEDLALNVDAILHNGAIVNGLLPYERVRAANVEGTCFFSLWGPYLLSRNKGMHSLSI